MKRTVNRTSNMWLPASCEHRHWQLVTCAVCTGYIICAPTAAATLPLQTLHKIASAPLGQHKLLIMRKNGFWSRRCKHTTQYHIWQSSAPAKAISSKRLACSHCWSAADYQLMLHTMTGCCGQPYNATSGLCYSCCLTCQKPLPCLDAEGVFC